MFMVGDIKQSIYKFRHACPEIFAQKYNTYDHTNLSEGNICISLNRNYRSRKSVLDFINIIFYQTMRKDFGGIDYTEADALKAGADFPNSELNICTDNELIICKKDSAEPVTSSEDIDELTEVEELADNEAEAHIIAQRISELINENNPTYVYDRKLNEYRPCRLSDITILMRSPNKAAYSYSNVLSSYGIPSVSGSKYTLFNELEIRTVMAILKVIDNPYQDRDLITVLHCPIYNVSCSELAKLKLINRNAFMYENVLCYIEQADENDTLKNKLTEFTALLKNVHQLILSKPFCEVLNYIFVATDYLNYLNLINNSSLRITNLKLLTAMAEQMFNSGITDFGSIVSGLCDIEKENPDFESTTLSDYENAVQILSIHKSKGLEFPIVFVAQFDKDLTRMFHADETFIDTDYGIALKCFDTQSRVKADFLYRTATLFLAKRSELTEELRLLYVALTRAKEKLIMVASAKKYDERMDKWSSCSDINRQNMYLPLSAVSESSSYLDWVMLAYFGCNALKDTIDIDSIFKIRTTNVADISTDNFGTEHLKDLYAKFTKDSAPEKETDELDRKLINDYLDMTAVTLPSKISISEIKRQHRVDEYKQLEYDLTALDAADSERILQVLNQNKERDTQVTFEPPTFIQESKDILYGAAKGTAYHTVFEHLRLDYSSTKESIEAQIHSLFERNILSKAELNCVQAEKFVKYLQSELGKRICKSQGVYRETPFVMQLSPNEIYDKEGYNDTFARILVHGIIDLYFEEDDELVLVDYKTDVVNSKNSPQNIRDRYKIQLEFYKKALERNTNKKVKEMYLYLVSIDEAIKYE
jgi:ATP-dependent helicase/nuclease subunit A